MSSILPDFKIDEAGVEVDAVGANRAAVSSGVLNALPATVRVSPRAGLSLIKAAMILSGIVAILTPNLDKPSAKLVASSGFWAWI